MGACCRPTGAAARGPRSACRVHCLSCEDFSSGPFRSTVECSRRSARGDSESDALAARFGVSGVVRQALTGCSHLFTATDAGVCRGGSSLWPANTRGVPVPPPQFPSRVDGPPCFSGGRVIGASFFHLRQELSPGWLQWYYAGGVRRGHPGALSSEIRRCTSGAPPCVSETVEVVRQGPECVELARCVTPLGWAAYWRPGSTPCWAFVRSSSVLLLLVPTTTAFLVPSVSILALFLCLAGSSSLVSSTVPSS